MGYYLIRGPACNSSCLRFRILQPKLKRLWPCRYCKLHNICRTRQCGMWEEHMTNLIMKTVVHWMKSSPHLDVQSRSLKTSSLWILVKIQAATANAHGHHVLKVKTYWNNYATLQINTINSIICFHNHIYTCMNLNIWTKASEYKISNIS